jgi:hypothetical protein
VVSIETPYVFKTPAQSLRLLIQKSINDAKPVEIEVGKGDKRDVTFKLFLKVNCAVGTTDNGKTTVVVLLDKDTESERFPLVVLGH